VVIDVVAVVVVRAVDWCHLDCALESLLVFVLAVVLVASRRHRHDRLRSSLAKVNVIGDVVTDTSPVLVVEELPVAAVR